MKCPYCNGYYLTEKEVYRHCLAKHRDKLRPNKNFKQCGNLMKDGLRKYILI